VVSAASACILNFLGVVVAVCGFMQQGSKYRAATLFQYCCRDIYFVNGFVGFAFSYVPLFGVKVSSCCFFVTVNSEHGRFYFGMVFPDLFIYSFKGFYDVAAVVSHVRYLLTYKRQSFYSGL